MKFYRNGKLDRISDIIEEIWAMTHGNEPVASNIPKTKLLVQAQRLLYDCLNARGESELKVCEKYRPVDRLSIRNAYLMNRYSCYEVEIHTLPEDATEGLPKCRLMFARYVRNNGRYGRRWLTIRIR